MASGCATCSSLLMCRAGMSPRLVRLAGASRHSRSWAQSVASEWGEEVGGKRSWVLFSPALQPIDARSTSDRAGTVFIEACCWNHAGTSVTRRRRRSVGATREVLSTPTQPSPQSLRVMTSDEFGHNYFRSAYGSHGSRTYAGMTDFPV